MSNSKEPIEGKPAFPGRSTHGLSERRYYIGQALTGLIANPRSVTSFSQIAIEAIRQADAVMALLYPDEATENTDA